MEGCSEMQREGFENDQPGDHCDYFHYHIREGCKKSKWKFKMAFAMKGGGGSRGGLECHIPILKNDFC